MSYDTSEIPNDQLIKTQLLEDAAITPPRPRGKVNFVGVVEYIPPAQENSIWMSGASSIRSENNMSEDNAILKTSRSFRISKLSHEWVESDYGDSESREDNQNDWSHIDYQERWRNAAVKALQTVLLLGEGNVDIKDDMLITAYLFLKNVKDEEGRIAPNCHFVVKHMLNENIESVLKRYNMDMDGKPNRVMDSQIRSGYSDSTGYADV